MMASPPIEPIPFADLVYLKAEIEARIAALHLILVPGGDGVYGPPESLAAFPDLLITWRLLYDTEIRVRQITELQEQIEGLRGNDRVTLTHHEAVTLYELASWVQGRGPKGAPRWIRTKAQHLQALIAPYITSWSPR